MSGSNKVTVNNESTYADTALQNQITAGLVINGAIPTIQSTLLHELQASGWTANLRTFLTQLMRSGECTRYDDLMDRVLEEALKGIHGEGKAASADSDEVDIRMPESAVKAGIKVVRKELEKICEA